MNIGCVTIRGNIFISDKISAIAYNSTSVQVFLVGDSEPWSFSYSSEKKRDEIISSIQSQLQLIWSGVKPTDLRDAQSITKL